MGVALFGISVPNFWLELHIRLGTYREGLRLTKKYLHTDYRRLVQEVVGRLWKGKDAAPYDTLVRGSRYISGVKETIAAIKKDGAATAIITSGPKDLALHHDAKRRAAAFHDPHLHGRGLAAQQRLRGDEERVERIPRRVILGDVERVEVVVLELQLRSLDDLKTAKPDPKQVQALDSYRADDVHAREQARAAGLRENQIAHLAKEE